MERKSPSLNWKNVSQEANAIRNRAKSLRSKLFIKKETGRDSIEEKSDNSDEEMITIHRNSFHLELAPEPSASMNNI